MKGARLLLQPALEPALRTYSQVSNGHLQGATFTPFFYIHGAQVSRHPSASTSQIVGPQRVPRWPVERYGVASSASRFPVDAEKHRLLFSTSPQNSGLPKGKHSAGQDISDHEYQTRVGKACRVLVDSLPDFMQKGVVDLQDLEPEHEASPANTRSRWSAKGLLPSLSPFLGQSLLRRSAWARKDSDTTSDEGALQEAHTFDSLYHPSIAFEFRPPLPHIGIGKSEGSDNEAASSRTIGIHSEASVDQSGSGTSLDLYDHHSRGGPTICFNGRTMYIASSHLLRHALSALFHDTSLHLESARFEGRSKAGSAWPGISPYIRRSTQSGKDGSDPSTAGSWQDKLVIRLRFEGISRVSSHPHTYTVIFKYEFDRATGMIARHVVDNIQPVPGSKVWAGLTNAWGTLTPSGAGGSAAPGGSTVCSPKVGRRGT